MVKTSFQDTTTHLLVHRLSSNQVFPQQLSVKGEVHKSSFIFQLLLLLSTLCEAQRTPSGTLTNQQFLQVRFENCKHGIKHFLITYLCQGFRSARRSTEFHTSTTTAELHTTTELYSTTATELHTTATELYYTTRFSPTAAPTTRPDPTAAAAACWSYSTTTTESTTCTIPTTAAESTPVTLSTTTTTAESTTGTVATTTTESPFPPAATTDKFPATASSHFSAEWLSAAGCSGAWHHHK